MAGNYAVSQGEYTGAELRQMMEWLVNVKDNGANPIRHRNYMPVTSGMEYKVTEYEQGKFRLEELTVTGRYGHLYRICGGHRCVDRERGLLQLPHAGKPEDQANGICH